MGDFKGRGGFGGPKGGDRGGDRYPKRDFGNRPRFDNNRAGGGFGGNQAAMHDAICSDCGNTCQVPFRPTGEKPVYCNNCFGAHKGADAGGFNKFEKKDFGPRRDDRGADRHDHKPAGAPVVSASMHDLKRRVDELHVKLDKLIAHHEGGAQKAHHVAKTVPAEKPKAVGNFVPQNIKNDVTARKEKMDNKSAKKEVKKEVKKVVKAKPTKAVKVAKKAPAKKKK